MQFRTVSIAGNLAFLMTSLRLLSKEPCFGPQVTELIREQSYLKSELGLGLGEMGFEIPPGESSESVFSQATSESSSVCSSPSHNTRRSRGPSGNSGSKPRARLVARKKIFRASVALTPTAPSRTGSVQTPPELESSEEAGAAEEASQVVGLTSHLEEEQEELLPAAEEMHRNVEQDELQQVIREVGESGRVPVIAHACPGSSAQMLLTYV